MTKLRFGLNDIVQMPDGKQWFVIASTPSVSNQDTVHFCGVKSGEETVATGVFLDAETDGVLIENNSPLRFLFAGRLEEVPKVVYPVEALLKNKPDLAPLIKPLLEMAREANWID